MIEREARPSAAEGEAAQWLARLQSNPACCEAWAEFEQWLARPGNRDAFARVESDRAKLRAVSWPKGC